MLKAVLLAASTSGSAVTGYQSADSHLDTDIDVRITSSLCFLEQEAGAIARASRGQETPQKHRSPPRRWKGSKNKGRRLELYGDGVILWFPS